MAEIGPIKEKVKDELLSKPNVIGVGIGNKEVRGSMTREQSLVIFVQEKLPPAALAAEHIVPAQISGIPTDVVQLGHVRALQSPTSKWRPAPGGVSIGHYKITAGTLGTIVTDKSTGMPLILSNNHVLANSNDANYGDPIYQPGPYDGGTENDRIGSLFKFIKIDFGEENPGDTCPLEQSFVLLGNTLARLLGSKRRVFTKRINAAAINYVDCALAMPDSVDLIKDEILNIGEVDDTADAFIGMRVAKSGRTTGYLEGVIKYVNATIQVSYGAGKVATFEDQLVTGYMSQGGDSGSLVVEIGTRALNPPAVGLLFAGSDQSTILNPIGRVLSELNVEI